MNSLNQNQELRDTGLLIYAEIDGVCGIQWGVVANLT